LSYLKKSLGAFLPQGQLYGIFQANPTKVNGASKRYLQMIKIGEDTT
jgi:hypothetical protein